jgi:hypothetical protein
VAAAKHFLPIFAVFAACIVLGGCARRHAVAELNGIIDLGCIHRPVRMIGCDFSQKKPKCKRFEIDYAPSCVQIEMVSNKARAENPSGHGR